MIVNFLLYLMASGDIIFYSVAGPVNSDWLESCVVTSEEGEVGGVNWSVVSSYSGPLELPGDPRPEEPGIFGKYWFDGEKILVR